MTDRKIDPMVYLKRILSENKIEFTPCLSGTIYPVVPLYWVMINHHDGYYSLGLYEQEAYENGGCAYDNILFERPDSCVRFLKALDEGAFDNCYVKGNIELWKAETDELHIMWMLGEKPEYVMKNHRDWINKQLLDIVKEKHYPRASS